MKRIFLLVIVSWASLLSSTSAEGLTFEKTIIEVLAAPDEDLVTAEFVFTNTSDQVAQINRYDAPCSCLEAQISNGGQLVWQSGESGSVKGLFKVGNFRGTVDKQITLLMKGGTSHTLTVRMTTPELVKIEPKTLKWNENGPAERQSFEVTVSEEHSLKILEVTATNKQKFPFELETIEEGKKYRLHVTPAATSSRGFGLLRIWTDSEFKKHQSYQAYVVITKEGVGKTAAQ